MIVSITSRVTPARANARGRAPHAAGARQRETNLTNMLATLLLVAATLALVANAWSQARGAAITSDESLYLSEAVSIADGRLEYASGDPITHRPPLFAATLAPIMAASDNSIAVARVVPIAYAVGAIASLYWLGRVLFGHRAACMGAALAAVASAPSHLAPGFFPDVAAAMWLFASIAALVTSTRTGANVARWSALAGGLLALSFLTKETAVLWLSLPAAFALLRRVPDSSTARALGAFYGVFAVLVLPWFAWVAAQTGEIFKVELTSPVLTLSAVTIGLGALIAVRYHGAMDGTRTRVAVAVALVAGWAALSLVVLESIPEPHARDYLRSVPDWTAHVFATGVEPWALVAVAWVYAAWRALRGDERVFTPLLAAAAGAPLYLFVANRGWELRQIIWLVYLSYLLAGWFAIAAATAISNAWQWREREAFALATVIALGFLAGFASDLRGTDRYADAVTDWHSADEQVVAGWVRALPDDTTVLSSRLYHSQLYVDSGGRIAIRQLPTLGVTLSEDGAIEPFGTMFRYEDAQTDLQAPRHWLALHRHDLGSYMVGLAEEDLVAMIQRSGAGFVLLSGDDGGFSSTRSRSYFDTNPAFTLIQAHEGDVRSYLYRIDGAALALRGGPLALSGEDLAYLVSDAGERAQTAAFWQALAPAGVSVDAEPPFTSDDLADLARQLAE
jgi:4-amino-4-deoxy-L-arabinose transferase-like glycosyltransferase